LRRANRVDVATPEEVLAVGGLQRALDRDRPFEGKIEPGEGRIVGGKLTAGLDGAPLEVTNCNPEHSH